MARTNTAPTAPAVTGTVVLESSRNVDLEVTARVGEVTLLGVTGYELAGRLTARPEAPVRLEVVGSSVDTEGHRQDRWCVMLEALAFEELVALHHVVASLVRDAEAAGVNTEAFHTQFVQDARPVVATRAA